MQACQTARRPDPPLSDSTATRSPFYQLSVTQTTDTRTLDRYVKDNHLFAYVEPESVIDASLLAHTYTTKELYIDVLRRAGQIRPDTSFPPELCQVCSRDSLRIILPSVSAVLGAFPDKTIIGALQQSSREEDLAVIIGEDDQEEISYDLQTLTNASRQEMTNGHCVAAIIPRSLLLSNFSHTIYTLQNCQTLEQARKLCEKGKYGHQEAPSKGTAFFVKDSTLVTAGHCLNKDSLQYYYFVFDFISEAGVPRKQFNAAQVFSAVSIKKPDVKSRGTDYCIVKLDRAVSPRRAPKFASQDDAALNAIYYVIGTPDGIPLKLAGNARVLNNSESDVFYIASDTFKGNSGSPVFNARHEIEGMLISGDADYKPHPVTKLCKVGIICMEDGCDNSPGEVVLRLRQFEHLIR